MTKFTKLIASTATAAAMFFTFNAKAQMQSSNTLPGKFHFDIGVDVGAPTGNAHRDLSDIELGGTLRAGLGISNNLAVIVTGGFYNLFNKNVTANGVTGKSPGLGIIPLTGGLKGFLGGGLYFTAESGAGLETSRDDATNQKDVKVILAPSLGFATKTWDISVHYDDFVGQQYNYGLVGLRLAYGF